MNALLHIQMDEEHGSLERLLRVTRHRGFNITQMNVSANQEHQGYDITLRVAGERELKLLTRQLDKLMNVQQLNVLSHAHQDAASAFYAQTGFSESQHAHTA
ncbi:acetolactate synthase 2 small subunit [Pleionea sp. CnH1-48]|uniref:acetolactate synthase 2 small subunit n=1 Tax=Pleionea sp. CnH1-48 TaxID=2954494 RepID=UPI002097EC84|nr:acetolactate synthase 2 small subunit [Pleionea sp. CnH1-48]MCO7227171.1 acetolactate synthase 2 small subunit [Pleionea sp. CnH1-48]